MRDRNINLGCGYQSLQDIGTFSLVTNPAGLNNVIHQEPKFTFDANFFDSNVELKKELCAMFGLSTNASIANTEIELIFDKISMNNHQVNYCVITLEWEKYRNYLDMTNSDNFINLAEELKNKEAYYAKYGDNIITQIVYGEKLLVVIQIDKAQQNLSNQISLKGAIPTPFVFGNVNLSTLLQEGSGSFISNIHIYSIGGENKTLITQTSVLSEIKSIRDQLAIFLNQSFNSTPTTLTAQDIEDKLSDMTQDVKDIKQFFTNLQGYALQNYLGGKQPIIENINVEKQDISKNPSNGTSDAKPEKLEPNDAIIRFSLSSIFTLIDDKDTETTLIAEELCAATAKAKKFLDLISVGYNRVQNYSDLHQYALNNQSLIKLKPAHKKEIEDNQDKVSAVKIDLERYENQVIYSAFKHEVISTHKKKTWNQKWNDIKLAIDRLSKITSHIIDYKNGSFLLGALESSYNASDYSMWGCFSSYRSGPYVEFNIPKITKNIIFVVKHDARFVEQLNIAPSISDEESAPVFQEVEPSSPYPDIEMQALAPSEQFEKTLSGIDEDRKHDVISVNHSLTKRSSSGGSERRALKNERKKNAIGKRTESMAEINTSLEAKDPLESLTFDIKDKKRGIIYKKLFNGSTQLPIFNTRSTADENFKVSIANPKHFYEKKINQNYFFKVKVYAQIGNTNRPISISKAPPVIIPTFHKLYSAPIDVHSKNVGGLSSPHSSARYASPQSVEYKSRTLRPEPRRLGDRSLSLPNLHVSNQEQFQIPVRRSAHPETHEHKERSLSPINYLTQQHPASPSQHRIPVQITPSSTRTHEHLTKLERPRADSISSTKEESKQVTFEETTSSPPSKVKKLYIEISTMKP